MGRGGREQGVRTREGGEERGRGEDEDGGKSGGGGGGGTGGGTNKKLSAAGTKQRTGVAVRKREKTVLWETRRGRRGL